MMNEEIYNKLEHEFLRNHIEEDVEDVLLGLAEDMADSGILNKDLIIKAQYGKSEVKACGVCTLEEEETNVYLKWINIGKTQIDIEDYFL